MVHLTCCCSFLVANIQRADVLRNGLPRVSLWIDDGVPNRLPLLLSRELLQRLWRTVPDELMQLVPCVVLQLLVIDKLPH